MTQDRYGLFGLVLESDLALPELQPAPDAAPDVVVRLADLAGWPTGSGTDLVRHGNAFTFGVPDVGQYAVTEDGRTVLVDPMEGASDRNVRLFLLGSAMGALLHVRGMLPLHANAVVVDGRAHAFMGHRGAGKSTLAAAFHDHGYRLLSDDVCVVTLADGVAMAQPGIPRLKLWRDALERTGRSEDGLERAHDRFEKFNIPVLDPDTVPTPLGGIHLLSSEGDGLPLVQRLRGSDAAAALIANTYRGGYLAAIGGRERHLRDCLTLAARVPITRLERAWDASNLHVERIVEQLRAA